MDATMVARWNERVAPTDSVYHLGDFGFGDCSDVFGQLNGRKFLIIGNHDDSRILRLPWAQEPCMYQEISVNERGSSTKLVLFHYGIRSWNGMFKGRLHLYGHSHGRLPGSDRCLDVGVDCWDFRPVNLADIKARMVGLSEWRPEVDS